MLRVSAKNTAKSVGKRLAQPFTRRVYGRIDARADQLHQEIQALPVAVDQRTAAVVDQRTAALEADVEVLNRYLPTVANTIASANAASRATERRMRALESSVAETRDRIEFVRREILLEQRYGASSSPARTAPSPGAGQAVTARVTDTEKLRRMQGNLRLNVGAGHIVRDGYLNVDSRELPGIDIVADVRDLPFDEAEVTEIYSSHVLEHFPVEELRRVVLPEWVSLLEDGGKLVSVVPDVETMVAERAAGRMPFEDFVLVMYGGQEYEGDFHFSGFSKETLTQLLEEAGLEDVKVIEEGRYNGGCYEMEVEAVRRIPSPE
jgi:predicted SAM-dependent methyltransferase